MTTNTMYEKGTIQVMTLDKENISRHIYKANLDQANIAKIARVGNHLEIELNTGEKLVIEDFFIGENPKELVLETASGQYFSVNLQEFDAAGVVTKVDYVGIDDFQEYLSDGESAIAPAWAWVATALSIIGIAASAGSSSGHHPKNENNSDKIGPIITHEILDNSHIKIGSDEASQIIITDATGKIIGSGQINQAGSIDITLTRPLQDNEIITITATDQSGNKTIESVKVGDVTDPQVEVDIVDNNTIQVSSNEVGSKVEIHDESGKTIGEGIVDSTGQVTIDIDEVLNDGDTIIINVTDSAGNSTTEVIVVGDVTPPIVSAEITDADSVEITSNEAGTIEITDINGNIIGRGIATGNDTVDEIQLDRPLMDGEKIVVTVTDGSENPKQIEVTAGDVTAPNFVSAIIDTTGTTLTLHYNENLDSTNLPEIENFTVTVGDVVVNVVGIRVDGQDVILTLDSAVAAGQNVQVSYTDPSASSDNNRAQKVADNNDTNAIQDIAGNDATNLTSVVVNNNSTVPITPTADSTAPQLQSVEVNTAGQLVFHYNEALDGTNLPSATDFNISINGQSVAPSTITISGNDVLLSFIPAIGTGQSVTYSYSDPSPNNDNNAIQDTAGNDANSIAQTTLPAGDNHSNVDSTAPEFVSASIDRLGTTLTLTYNETLDGTNLPAVSNFTVTVGGVVVSVAGITVNGQDVILSLSQAVTVGQTVQVSYTDPSVSNDNNAIQDIVGNDAADLTSTLVDNNSSVPTADSTAPQLQNVEVNTAGQLVFHYNEALDGTNLPSATDFNISINGQTATPTSVTVTGNDVLLSFIPAIGTGQSVTYSYSDPSPNNDPSAIQDTAGNDATDIAQTTLPAGDNHSNVDSTAPQLQSVEVNTIGQLVFHYNEALDGTNLPSATDFNISINGQSVAPTSVTVTGNDVLLSFIPAIGTGQSVSYSYNDPSPNNDPSAIQDTAGNDANSITQTTLPAGDNNSTIDVTAPVLQSVEVNTAGQLVFHYNEALDGTNLPSATDFNISINGQTVAPSTITISGNDVLLSFVPVIGIGQSVSYSYSDPSSNNDSNAIQDVAGNDATDITQTTLPAGDNHSNVDSTAPQLQSVEVNTTGQLVFHYNEALDGTNLPSATDFNISINGQTVTPTSVTVTGNDVLLSFVPAIGTGQSVTYSYSDPSPNNDPSAIQDTAGNDATDIAQTTLPAGDNHSSVDNTAPQLQNVEVNTTGQLVFHYNETLDGTNLPSATDFNVSINGQTVTATSVTVTGNDVLLSFIPAIGTGQSVSYSYSDPSPNNDTSAIQDVAGNDASSIAQTTLPAGDNHSSVDSTAPILQSVEVNTTGQLVFHYNEALDGTNLPSATDFNISINGQTVTPTSVTVTGNDVLLSFIPAIGTGQSVTYSYSDPSPNNDPSAIQDTAGNDATDIAQTTLPAGDNHSNVDSTAPEFVSASIDTLGTTLTLTYNETLDGTNLPAVSNFTVTVGGIAVSVAGITINGQDVILTLNQAVTVGQTVQVSYTDPSVSNDSNAIQDIVGNDAADLSSTLVDNNSSVPTADSTAPQLQSVEVNTTGQLVFHYNEALDGTNLPSATDFNISINGQSVAPSTITISGNDVLLSFIPAIGTGQSVTYSYSDPSPNNDLSAIQDTTGNDASSIPLTTLPGDDNNSTVDVTAPVLQSVEVNTVGQLVFHYNEALDGTNLPSATDFNISINGQTVTPTSVTVTGNDVLLSFIPVIGTGQSVSYSYNDPSPNNDPSAIQDTAGNDANSIAQTTLPAGDNHSNVDSTAPILQSVEVNTAGQLVFHYNEALDGTNLPSATDFNISINGQTVTPTSITVTGNDVLLSFVPAIGTGQSVTYSYNDPSPNNDPSAIQDTAGNDANSIAQTTLPAGDNHSNVDSTAPQLQSVEVNTAGQLVFHYNEALDGTNLPSATDFNISINGQTVTATSVTVTGNDVLLSFIPAIGIGQSVSYSYSDPSPNNDTNAIQDFAGNDAKSIAQTTLPAGDNHSNVDSTAPVLQSVEVNTAGQLVFHYNEALDGTNLPRATDFNISINGQTVTATSITVTGNGVLLSFIPAIGTGQSVTYSYNDPSPNNDPSAIQDTAGNDANSIAQTTLPAGDNHSNVDSTAPEFVSASIDPLGTTLTLTYNETLDGTNLPAVSNFTVTVGGVVVSVAGITVNGQDVILSLSQAVTVGQTVQVSYTDPSVSNDSNAIQDIVGNDAADLSSTLVDNNSSVPTADSTAPQLQSVEVNTAGQLVFHYNEALNGTNLPSATDFNISINGQAVTPTSITVTGNDVLLSFIPAIGTGQSVTYSYSDPSPNNDPSAIQDTAGNDATDIAQTTLPAGDNHSTIDITPPPAPIILGAEDNIGTFGNIYSGGLTDDLTPTIYGVAEENSIVTVFVNSLEVGTAIADGSGRWSYEPTLTNPTFRSVQGSNFQITATATDASNNVSPVSNIFDIGTYQANSTQNPITALKDGSLLGLVGLDALGLIRLDNQPIAAYDVNNDLKKVVIKNQPFITLDSTIKYSQSVADLLSLQINYKEEDILSLLGIKIGSVATLEITAKDGGIVSNNEITEFLASVYVPSLLNVSVLPTLSIEAWDSRYISDANKDSSNQIIGYGKTSATTVADVQLLSDTKIGIYDQLAEFDQHLNTSNVRLYGTSGDDTLQGGSLNDILRGGDGVDTLKGNAGNDWLEGGKGNDFLTGGIGSDTAIYHLLVANDATGGNGTDTWTDFHKGNVTTDSEADKIDIAELLGNAANIGSIQQYLSVSYDVVKDQTVIQVDRDGTGATYTKSDLLILEHVNTTLEELIQNQQIIF